MPYILEVQRFNPSGHEIHPNWNGKSEHVGYINKVFATQKEAGEYYDEFNPHMRKLNAHNTWMSDWGPRNGFMYIVRERFYEYLIIPPFDA